jgi:two-component system chemotaxis sensor kinase CheA
MNQYMSVFIDEANDHLQSLNDHMLQLEQSPDDISIVQVIFRSAHTLKGMSATMGFEDLASLTHEMENVLDLIRNSKLSMNSEIFDTLFKCLDALEGMVQDIVAGGDGKRDVSDLVARLKAIVSGDMPPAALGAGSGPQAAKPSADQALDTYQMSILMQSIDTGYTVHFIEVTLRDDCLLKAARAYMVFDVLEKNGEVVKSHPPAQDIEQEKFDRSFSVYYITKADPNAIRDQIARISEIASVNMKQLSRDALQEMIQAESEAAATQAVQDAPASASPKQQVSTAQAPAAQQAAARPQAPRAGAATRTIRVDIERLDTLMNLFSELLIDRVRLEQLASEIGRSDLTETVEHMSRVSADLQNIVMKLRMMPVDSVFNRFPRMVRDLARSLDKKVDLIITGAETELDRTVIDEIGDPLVHLLRNSVDHGVETVQDRLAAGKPETGNVYLRAYHSGNHVFIEIEDDGRGINREKVLAAAVKRGVLKEEEGKNLTDQEVYMLLFASGLSTAEKVSDVSGRGVGLDVVKTKIESLGGHVTVQSELGRGSKFTIQLPLTLSIISAMLIKLGSEKYAFPLSSIVETAALQQSSIRNVHGQKMLEYRDSVIPVLSLAKLVDSPDYSEEGETETEALIIRKGNKLAAVLVDDFIGQSEIVLKTLGKYLTNVDIISGATILGDGQVALIVDPNALIK